MAVAENVSESPKGSLTDSSDSSNTTDFSQSKEELIIAEKDSVVVINNPLNPVILTPKQQAAEKERKRKIRVGSMMSIAYAANIGGTGSQIGSSPQLALKGILQELVHISTLR